MVELELDSPEWHIQHLENEKEFWLTMLKNPELAETSGRRTYIKNKIRQMDYLIDQHRQALRERESEGVRRWLTK